MKTRCCQSGHFKVEGLTVVCVNQDCSNYLAPTTLFTKRFLNRFTGALLFAFILCFCENDYSSVNRSESAMAASSCANRKKSIQCTDEALKSEIRENKMICPEEVFAQIVIESGHMTSFLFKRANNLLGMRYPFKRATTAIGIYLPDEDRIVKGDKKELMKYAKRNQYAVFETWQDCVLDYKQWQNECFKLTDRYLNFLGTYYASDSQYVSKIKRIAK